SFLLDGVTPSARGRYTVVLRSKTPNTALPSILTNTSLGVVNSKLVRKHGGTSAVGADKNDKAERFLNSAASRGAGSGPYLLQRYSTTSQITLVPNPRYWGTRKAAFKTVVVRNMIAPTQLINIQRGSHEVAIDLSADQAQTIKGNLTKARSELAASGAAGKTITLEYPSDLTINGVPFGSLAQRVQANLQQVGFKIDLTGSTVGTWLQKYRDGKMAFGLSLWG